MNYTPNTLAYQFGNFLMGEILPIDIGEIKAGTLWAEQQLFHLQKNHEKDLASLDPSSIKNALIKIANEWKSVSHDE